MTGRSRLELYTPAKLGTCITTTRPDIDSLYIPVKSGKNGEKMIANKAYKYRIYPNKGQEELIQKTFGCVRFVYNHFLFDRITAYKENGEIRSCFQQIKMLTDLKNEYEWLKEPDKNALQCALRNLDKAYQNFFRNVKKGDTPGFPKFKRKKDNQKSYQTVGCGNQTRIENGNVRLPKLGVVKTKLSRNLPEGARILNATVSQEPSGKYFVSIGFEYELDIPEHEVNAENSIGLDYSSPHFYVDSDGNKANMHHFYREAERKLAREQRRLSRKQKGSANYEKQRIKVARAFEKVRNCRQDWQHKLSTKLAEQYDIVAVEDIDYKAMSQGLHLGKATNDNGFGQFRTFLSYKLAERGKKLITIDKWFPSSKTCRHCGYINSELTIKERKWKCPKCGELIDRDVNAAINIRNEGIRIYAV